MELWMRGVCSLLQSGIITLLSTILANNRRARTMTAGAALALTLFVRLPEATQLCSAMILLSAMVLGIIVSVFLRESVSNARYRSLLWGVWLMIHTCLQASGHISLSPLHLITIGPALSDKRLHIGMLWLFIPVTLGWMLGLSGLPTKWIGLLLSLGCGLLIESIMNCNQNNLAGGIAIGVILSFI